MAYSSSLIFINERVKLHSVEVIDEDEVEEKESFSLSLIRAHPHSVIINQDSFAVTIVDNDGEVATYILTAF